MLLIPKDCSTYDLLIYIKKSILGFFIFNMSLSLQIYKTYILNIFAFIE
jgi:hypothetical protein